MKATGSTYRIVTTDKGRTWQVVCVTDGIVVKTCRRYVTARNWHAAYALDLSYVQASKLRN